MPWYSIRRCLPTFRYNSIHVCHALSHPVDACEQHQRCQSLSSCRLHPMSPSRCWKKVCVRSSRFFAFCRNCLELPLSIIFVGIGVQTDPVGRELGCDLGGTASLGCDQNDYNRERSIARLLSAATNKGMFAAMSGNIQLQDFKFLRELTKDIPEILKSVEAEGADVGPFYSTHSMIQ